MSSNFEAMHTGCGSRIHKTKVLLTCNCGCGQEFLRTRSMVNQNGLSFLSKAHHSAYIMNTYLAESCGSYLPLVTEYLDGAAKLRYGNIRNVRITICPFFLYLTQHDITSIEDVTPEMITNYLTWAVATGHRAAARDVSALSGFFMWAIVEGYREDGNPVIPSVHGRKKKKRSARPYSPEELDVIWKLLIERSNPRILAVAAIAEEAGLRIGEICRLQLEDVDLVRKQLFIRLPNKTSRERYAFFSEKTTRYLMGWLAGRDPDCGHSYLFHNYLGDPSKYSSLVGEFKRVLCRTWKGRMVNEVGLGTWSIHRMRHTMASNLIRHGADAATVMSAGGWVTYAAMSGYVQVDGESVRHEYSHAMQKVRDQRFAETTKKVLTPEEFLMQRKKVA